MADGLWIHVRDELISRIHSLGDALLPFLEGKVDARMVLP